MSADPRIGTELGGYRIEARIGRGGMSTVYLAEHVRLGRKVALKILSSELALDEGFRTRFERESQLAASLDHPNIVPVYDAGEVDGVAYIAMRHIDGRDLGSLLAEDGRLEPSSAAAVIAQVADALDAAHALGLVHRDVKPGNVLLHGDHAYLTDFGLTKRLDAATVKTDTGHFMGTIHYAAPEQFEGRPLDARTDEYSLACVAFHCLTGRPPFPREQEAAVMFAHLREPIPPPSETAPGSPRPVDAVVARAMSKSKEDRYATCGQFSDALTRTASGQKDGGQGGRPRPRKRTLVAGAGLILAVGAAIAFAAVVAGSDAERRSPSSSPSVSGSPSSGSPEIGTAVISIDPATSALGEGVEMPSFAQSVAVADGFVWIRAGGSRLLKLNVDTNVVVGTILVENCTGSTTQDALSNKQCVAAHGDAVWIVGGYSLGLQAPITVERIDPNTNEVDLHRRIASPTADVRDIALGGGDVWVSAWSQGVYRFSPGTDEVVAIPIDGASDRIAFGEGSLFVVDSLTGSLHRIDPSENEVVDSILLEGTPNDIVVGDRFAWVTDAANDRVLRIATDFSSIDHLDVGESPSSIAFGGGAVWVSNQLGRSVSRIDIDTGDVETFDVPGFPGDIAVGEGRVWLTLSSEPPLSGVFG